METTAKDTNTESLMKVYKKYLPKTQKRDGRIVRFNFENIVSAIAKAMHETNEGSPEEARVVAHRVAGELMLVAKKYKDFVPNVEAIQDVL